MVILVLGYLRGKGCRKRQPFLLLKNFGIQNSVSMAIEMTISNSKIWHLPYLLNLGEKFSR